MLVSFDEIAHARVRAADVVVVGAGPCGITLALDLGRRGVQVLLVESGHQSADSRTQALGDAQMDAPHVHAPMHECTRRQLGGASVIWGGRCVPFDPIDLAQRPFIPHAEWPIEYDDVARYFERASAYFRIGRPCFDLHDLEHVEQKTLVPGLVDTHVLTSCLERWSLPTNFGREYRAELMKASNVQLLMGATCVEIQTDDRGDHVVALRVRRLDSDETLKVVARRSYVIACGGLESTRLLLASDRKHEGGIGNHGGQLGRFYMGHISGHIARVHFDTPPRDTVYAYDRDVDATYVRRRMSFTGEFQQQEHLTNVVAWLVNPEIGLPAHRNGVLSFAYLALASPLGKYLVADAIRKAAISTASAGGVVRHVANMLRDLPRTLWFIPSFAVRRYLVRRRVPGFFQFSADNVYPLHYHGEQVPNPDSRVTLADEVDALGMRRLRIDLRFSDQDVDGVLRAHDHWDANLRAQRCGYLEYTTSDPRRSVWEQARDGFHQAGTTRMSARAMDGVVDPQCRVHGIDNLYVASSSVFVTSGQANSTFTAVALTLRLADHLCGGGA